MVIHVVLWKLWTQFLFFAECFIITDLWTISGVFQCNYLIPGVCCIIILKGFDIPAYTSSTNFPSVVALFLMYGWVLFWWISLCEVNLRTDSFIGFWLKLQIFANVSVIFLTASIWKLLLWWRCFVLNRHHYWPRCVVLYTVGTPYKTVPYTTGSNIARLGHGSQNS